MVYVELALAFEFRKSDQREGHPILDLYVEGSLIHIVLTVIVSKSIFRSGF